MPRVVGASAIILTAACFKPLISEGVVECGQDARCPSGFFCHNDDRCYSSEPGAGDMNRGDTSRGDDARGDRAQGDLATGDTANGDTHRGDNNRGDTLNGDLNRGDTQVGDRFMGDGNDALPQFTEDAGNAGIVDTMLETYGTAWADINGDGRLDLMLGGWTDDSRVYFNDGDGTFTQQGAPTAHNGRQMTFADFDDDGDQDIFVACGSAGGNVQEWFYDNNGAGYTERAVAAGLDGNNVGGVVVFDFDGDGYLDMFYPEGNGNVEVRINGGNAPVTFSVVDDTALGLGMVTFGNGEVIAGSDIDDDGDVDIWYNDAGTGSMLVNNGNGTFTENASGAGVSSTTSNGYNGAAFGDYDNDGDLDLFLAQSDMANNKLYQNQGNGTFTLMTALGVDLGESRGANWGDMDHDGDLDLVVGNDGTADAVYRNNGDGTFTDVAPMMGMGNGTNATSSATFADYDNDGDLDILFAGEVDPEFLYRNDINDRKFLKVHAVGAGPPLSAKEAFFSRVELRDATGATLLAVREVRSGSGFGSQPPRVVHFGLAQAWGGANGPYTVEVRFPNGDVRTATGIVPRLSSIVLGSTTWANTIEVLQ